MRLLKLAAVALNQTPLDWQGNIENILTAIDAARQAGAQVVCLPELCITGYGCEDAFLSPDVQQRAAAALMEIVPRTAGLVVSVGLPCVHLGALYNCSCLMADGQILGLVAKQNLAGDGIHYEPRWFKPWPEGQTARIELADAYYPLGDLIFDCGGVRIGFEICEDAWAAQRPGSRLARAAVDIILNPSASHFAFGKQEIRKQLVIEGSRAFGVSYVYANLLGNEAGRVIYDGGTLIASAGRLMAQGPRFSMTDHTVTTAVVDLDTSRMQRARLASYQPDEHDATANCIEHAMSFPAIDPEPVGGPLPDWETGPNLKEEEFARAVSLGLFDYLRKSRCNGFVVSLSGGADSSAATVLVWLLVRFGIGELGREGFIERLAHVQGLDQAAQPEAIVRRLLTCVYQSTENSSQVTRDAAAAVASALGAEFIEFNVDSIVRSYVGLASGVLGRELNWEEDDIALQNIQARARGPGAWLLANLHHALLLATSNRSEAAVGYATMDGDTCGSLSPIAGIDKAFLRRWLAWMCHEGPEGVGSVPALDAVLRQQPTAELRPQEAGQTDEQDLMPYDLLDAIERAAIRDKHGPIDVFRLMRSEFPDYNADQLIGWIERFFKLWARNQWKRERYAPSFHLDDENLDPKTWCRFPILSGGFDRELADLRKLRKAEDG
ncbi:MAG: NAD(+) synthase [Pirellulales bacterium]|nr:NAD(+) synthase [Pirellulales bacterium]